jgi:hypothetical protein
MDRNRIESTVIRIAVASVLLLVALALVGHI